MLRTQEKREDVLAWLRNHEDAVEGDAGDALTTLEEEVRHHARALAWDHAISIVRARANFWRHRHNETRCPECWAAREFCREFASGLRMFEPIPDARSHDEFVGALRMAQFAPDAQSLMVPWLKALAEEEEHRAWNEVIGFTKGRVDVWIREGEITTEREWDLSQTYAEAAVHACELLEWDYTLRFIGDAKAERAPIASTQSWL